MRDPTTGKLIRGKTRWRRFFIILGPALGVVAVMMFLVMQGALAVNFAISGIPFKLTAGSLSGDNFIQFALNDQVQNPGAYGTTGNNGLITRDEASLVPQGLHMPTGFTGNTGTDGKFYVADTITELKTASISDLHQTVCVPLPAPLAGLNMLVEIYAGQTTPVTTGAGNALYVQAPALQASSATFTNIQIGADLANAQSTYGYPSGGLVSNPPNIGLGAGVGLFSQAADHVVITNLHQVAVGTEAGSFTLPGLSLTASFVGTCP